MSKADPHHNKLFRGSSLALPRAFRHLLVSHDKSPPRGLRVSCLVHTGVFVCIRPGVTRVIRVAFIAQQAASSQYKPTVFIRIKKSISLYVIQARMRKTCTFTRL